MFPSSKAVEEGRVDEERRLFYVVVTRAKDRLYMFVPQIRKMPDGGMIPLDGSIFVKEIPDRLLNVRRVQSYPDAYARGGGYGSGYGSGGSRGGYGGGGYGGRLKPPQYKTTWRR